MLLLKRIGHLIRFYHQIENSVLIFGERGFSEKYYMIFDLSM